MTLLVDLILFSFLTCIVQCRGDDSVEKKALFVLAHPDDETMFMARFDL